MVYHWKYRDALGGYLHRPGHAHAALGRQSVPLILLFQMTPATKARKHVASRDEVLERAAHRLEIPDGDLTHVLQLIRFALSPAPRKFEKRSSIEKYFHNNKNKTTTVE